MHWNLKAARLRASRFGLFLTKFGSTENAGRENDGLSKMHDTRMQDMKMQDMKMQDGKIEDTKQWPAQELAALIVDNETSFSGAKV